MVSNFVWFATRTSVDFYCVLVFLLDVGTSAFCVFLLGAVSLKNSVKFQQINKNDILCSVYGCMHERREKTNLHNENDEIVDKCYILKYLCYACY